MNSLPYFPLSITRTHPLFCFVFHVLIPPAPFSAVAKKGVTIELHYRIFPLFARAERGTQGGEYM